MQTLAGSAGTAPSPSLARRAVPVLVALALVLTSSTPAVARSGAGAVATAQVAAGSAATTVTIGARQTAGVHTFTGTVTPAVAGVQVTIARLGADGRVTGVVSTRTVDGGGYEVSTSLPAGFTSYYALTAPTTDLPAGRSRLHGLVADVRAGQPVAPTVSLEVRRGSDGYVFSGLVHPPRAVPVTLARHVDGRLVGVVGSGRPTSAYAFSVPVEPGTHHFQVLTGAADGLAAGRSRVYGLVVPPATGARPVAVAPVHGGSSTGD